MSQEAQIVTPDVGKEASSDLPQMASRAPHEISVTLFTGGGDRPYAFGLATELMAKNARLDVIAGDDLDCPVFRGKPGVNFLNLRGDQRPDVSFSEKMSRVAKYYARLFRYVATAKPKIFHILWNNKFELFDRTLLMLLYRALAKKIVLTVHNVNARKRDSNDTALNRLTLRIQYRLADHLFVHTEQMKRELIQQFGVRETRITIIPFGINNSIPNTNLTSGDARHRLGIRDGEKAILFFGNITPYKGLEYLTAAFQQLRARHPEYRLIIAGWPKNCEAYWNTIRESIKDDIETGRIILRAHYISDEETEVFFKAADVLALPYRYIYQSGVLFLGYSFGLPVLATDVGSLKDEIVGGKTGFVVKPDDPADLARTIERYFASDLFAELGTRRETIRTYASEKHSWDVVGKLTMDVYAQLLHMPVQTKVSTRQESKVTLDVKAPS
ncbi:MAG: glycosyltransferase family 4 protein [Candidatus Acidiferrales bacterium]